MKTDELREKYLTFFQSKGHTLCRSDVLVPTWDPSVLFTPAGMNQFKDHFLGKVKLEFTRATSCQKCLRTGDIENVGRTAYHHTFFEMLGNFSFGDYFKREAIHWAWEFLTLPKWLGMAPERLTVSVYLDDDEAYRIWQQEIGLPADRIERMGERDNFWPAGAPTDGPDGVCGPCSEIFFHPPQGESVEIWNLVFTQFNRVGHPPDNLHPLPSKNIDTGMGLERAAATLQGVDTNFHIDTLLPLVKAAAEVCGVPYHATSDNGRRLRRIADHVRACSMAVHENVYPGPQKEKYVVRRLLRRAVLDGHQMGVREPFLYRLVPTVAQMMKAPYPELGETVERVQGVIRAEESNFFGTIDAGLSRAQRIFRDAQSSGQGVIDGHAAAELYQTYGVPPELVESLAAERNLQFDWNGFRAAMAEHGETSGKVAHAVMSTGGPLDTVKQALGSCQFLGYDSLEASAVVRYILSDGQLVDTLSTQATPAEAVIVLDRTPFYGESGGQVGDTGSLRGDHFVFRVTDTRKDGGLILHQGQLEPVESSIGCMKAGDRVLARVDPQRRSGIRRAHSATHLLHHALQQELGSHAQQQGSKVDDDWLRFDFTHMAGMTDSELQAIEARVGARIVQDAPIRSDILPLAEARQLGAMMLFGEKYPDPVRMITMGDFSRELCGGTHLDHTGAVQAFEVITEESVAAGTRRVVALTGDKARQHQRDVSDAVNSVAQALGVVPRLTPIAVQELVEHVRQLRKNPTAEWATPVSPAPPGKEPEYPELKGLLKLLARQLHVAPFDVPNRVQTLLAERQSAIEQAKKQTAAGTITADHLLTLAEPCGDTRVIVEEIPVGSADLMRQLIDQIRSKASSSAVLMASVESEDKVTLVAGVSRDLVARGIQAGNWVRAVAPLVGGGGGGRPDLAQAGGKNPQGLAEAIEKAKQWIREQLAGART